MPSNTTNEVSGSGLPCGRSRLNKSSSLTRWYFCFGNCEPITVFLGNKDGKLWLILMFFDAVLRGVGQVVFANNPFSGLLILIGLFWYNLVVGSIVLASTSIAIVTALSMKQNPDLIRSGLVSFNAVLLSSVTSSLWTPLYGEPIGCKLLIFILVGSSLSVFISNGISNILSSFKPSIPMLSIPFHILVFVLFVCLKPSLNANTTIEPVHVHNSTSPEIYSWDTVHKIGLAVVYSASQVFGIANAATGLLIYAGMLMFSPILTFMCLHGAMLGTILGLFLTPFPNDEVFLGVWSFNGFLSCGAIGLFYIFNCYSFINGTASVVFTTVVQRSLTSHFAESHLPVFGLPFIFSSVLFVCVTSERQKLRRALQITFPERQRKEYFKQMMQKEVIDYEEEVAQGRSLLTSKSLSNEADTEAIVFTCSAEVK